MSNPFLDSDWCSSYITWTKTITTTHANAPALDLDPFEEPWREVVDYRKIDKIDCICCGPKMTSVYVIRRQPRIRTTWCAECDARLMWLESGRKLPL